MTSEAKVAANRANARRSTGPRSAEGKARAATNAIRHGFGTALSPSSNLVPQLSALLANIVNGPTSPESMAVAEAQLHLQRIRARKQFLLEAEIRNRLATIGGMKDCSPEERLALALIACAPEFQILDGYERKALSRRKSAVRALDDARKSPLSRA